MPATFQASSNVPPSDLAEKNVKVIANAGGVNPEACRAAVRAALTKGGAAAPVSIGVITGDDILSRLDELIESGIELANLDTGAPLAAIRHRVQSANVYLGAWPIVEALGRGARIVITGRCSDPALSLAAEIHEFGWKPDDWNHLAAGVVAGHAIECGAQVTGGNCQVDWENIPDLADIGYPILEAEPDGTFVVTKHRGTGGRVTVAGVTEQLLYEIGDPKTFLTPDVTADFTTIRLEQAEPDRVRFSGIEGRAPTNSTKSRSVIRRATRPPANWCMGGPTRIERRRRPTGFYARGWTGWGCGSTPFTPQFVGANACHGERLSGEPSPDLALKFSCGSASVRKTRRPWTGSRRRSRRWR